MKVRVVALRLLLAAAEQDRLAYPVHIKQRQSIRKRAAVTGADDYEEQQPLAAPGAGGPPSPRPAGRLSSAAKSSILRDVDRFVMSLPLGTGQGEGLLCWLPLCWLLLCWQEQNTGGGGGGSL